RIQTNMSCHRRVPTHSTHPPTPAPTNTHTRPPTSTATPTIVTACGAIIGSITAGDGTQIGRMTRNAVIGTCAVPKAYPGTNDATVRHYDSYRFINTTGGTACVTVQLSNSCANNVFSAAYLTAYDPSNISTNY